MIHSDLLILPSQIEAGKLNMNDIIAIKHDAFPKRDPDLDSLQQHQREVREPLKILIHLWAFVHEKLNARYEDDYQTPPPKGTQEENNHTPERR